MAETFYELRKRLGMGRRQLAALLRIKPSEVYSYQSGHLETPYLVTFALAIYEAAMAGDQLAIKRKIDDLVNFRDEDSIRRKAEELQDLALKDGGRYEINTEIDVTGLDVDKGNYDPDGFGESDL